MHKVIWFFFVLLFWYSYSFSQPVGYVVGDDFFREYGMPFNWDKIESSSYLKPKSSEYPKDYYNVMKIDDGNEDTVWVEGVKGPGIGEWIKMWHINWTREKKYCVVNAVWIKNGYMKNKELYYANNRVKKLRIEFSEGEQKVVELKDGVLDYQKIKLGEIKTKWIKVVIIDVYKGSKYDDTCISELEFWCYTKDWYDWVRNEPLPEGVGNYPE